MKGFHRNRKCFECLVPSPTTLEPPVSVRLAAGSRLAARDAVPQRPVLSPPVCAPAPAPFPHVRSAAEPPARAVPCHRPGARRTPSTPSRSSRHSGPSRVRSSGCVIPTPGLIGQCFSLRAGLSDMFCAWRPTTRGQMLWLSLGGHVLLPRSRCRHLDTVWSPRASRFSCAWWVPGGQVLPRGRPRL